MRPIAIFYHVVFVLGDEVLESALSIVDNQVQQMDKTGLINASTEFHVGVNGGPESTPLVVEIFPKKSQVMYHGLESRAENLTIVALENWAKHHEGWDVLYLHSKGATHAPGNWYGDKVSGPWREGMMNDLVGKWRHCVHFFGDS